MAEDAIFRIGDVTLGVPEAELSGPLRKALNSGRFEHLEQRALDLHLRADDSVLELGAGSGLITIHAARKVGSDRVVSVEPNPAMPQVIVANLARNGLAPVTVIPAAVVAPGGPATVPFYLHGGFWAASLDRRDTPRETVTEVATVSLDALVAKYAPSVITADLEGAEAEVFATPLPDSVRIVILELHPKRYPAAAIGGIFATLAEAGLVYCPEGSQGKVVVFGRARPGTSYGA